MKTVYVIIISAIVSFVVFCISAFFLLTNIAKQKGKNKQFYDILNPGDDVVGHFVKRGSAEESHDDEKSSADESYAESDYTEDVIEV